MNRKLRELTPLEYACANTFCPAVFQSDTGTYVIIGKACHREHAQLRDRIGPDETVLEVSADLLEAALAAGARIQSEK